MHQPSSALAAHDRSFFGHPRGLSTLFFTEMWERFSYYGMRAILVLFMTNAIATGGMGLDDVTATAIYGFYTAAVYIVALPGGWVADRLLGLRRAVFLGGAVIAAGHFTLAIPSALSFYLGLILIVIGTGKPGALKQQDFVKLGGAAMGKLPPAAAEATIFAELPGGAMKPAQAADVALGVRLRAYAFDRYKTKRKDEEKAPAKRKVMIGASDVDAARRLGDKPEVLPLRCRG